MDLLRIPVTSRIPFWPKSRRMQFPPSGDRKSTRLNSSHSQISYAVFCLKKQIPAHSSSNWQTVHHELQGPASPDIHSDPHSVAHDTNTELSTQYHIGTHSVYSNPTVTSA